MNNRFGSVSKGWPWAAGGALIVAALAFEWWRRYHYNVCDDSLISLQYARNVARGFGFVFNPGERVEGFTNFLWVAVLALAYPLSDETSAGFVRLAVGLSIALAAVDILLLYRLARLIWPRRLAPVLLALGLCIFDNSYTVWAMQALESHLLLFTMLVSCLFLWGAPSKSNAVGATLGLSATMMTRPDAVLFVGVLGAGQLVHAWRSSEARRAMWRVLAIFGATGLIFGIYFLWRYQYFGYLLPNTFYVKASGLRGQAIERGWQYLHEYLSDRAYVPLLALGAIVGIRDRIVGPLFGWVLIYAAYVVYVGGDFYPGQRFFVVVTPFAALLCAYSLDRAARWISGRWSSRPGLSRGVWAFGAALVITVAIRGLLVGPLQTEVVRWGGEVERVRAFMQWLGAQAPPGASIVTGDIGSSGYYANLYVYDYFGIIDPVTAHQSSTQLGRGKAGHEKHADAEYLLAKEPTYIKWGYMDRGLYERGYYFDSDLPASLNVAGIWRRDVLAKERNLQLVSRLSFERDPYAGWTATGEAFEHWPVRTAPPNQGRPVGQAGWFVSSYHPKKGDAAIGELRSPPRYCR